MEFKGNERLKADNSEEHTQNIAVFSIRESSNLFAISKCPYRNNICKKLDGLQKRLQINAFEHHLKLVRQVGVIFS